MEEFVIPEELLVNILVRLPIKDIFRFKLVCKSWLGLISSSDPYFTSNYARNSPFTLIFRATDSYYDDPNKLSLSVLEFAKKGGRKHTQIPLLTPKIPDHQDSDSRLSFVGSCDCSVFILHCKPFNNDHVINRVYSYNPVSGSCIAKLVAEDITGKQKQELMKYKVGFIPSNSTYKLLRFDPGWEKADEAEIFTVGLDENWRTVDDPLLFCGAFHYYEAVVCFNGAYHWLSSCDCEDNDEIIFTFNLLEEKCGTRIPKPYGVSRHSRVTILNGRLSVADLIDEYNCVKMVIWTMKEYGVVESWSKVAVLTFCDDQRPNTAIYHILVPIAVLANGDILFNKRSIQGGMCYYNLQEKRLSVQSSRILHRIYECTYVPRFYTFDS